MRFDDFERLVADLHKLRDSPFLITYTESSSGDLLPINNDENLAKALVSARPMLRLSVYRKGLFNSVDYYDTISTLSKLNCWNERDNLTMSV